MANSEATSLPKDWAMLECAICLHDVTNHRMLPCQHTFCQSCLEPLVKQQTITCPVCREVCKMKSPNVSSLARHLMLVALLDKTCENCRRKDREVSCKHCGRSLCGQCFDECKMTLAELKESTTHEILSSISLAAKILDEVQGETIRIHQQHTKLVKQVKEQFKQKTNIRHRQLREQVEHNGLQEKILTEEKRQLQTRLSQVEKEMKEIGSSQNKLLIEMKRVEDIKLAHKGMQESVDKETDLEIGRLKNLSTDIARNLKEMHRMLSQLCTHSHDSSDTAANITEICDKWKTDAPDSTAAHTLSYQLYIQVVSVSNDGNEPSMGKIRVRKQPVKLDGTPARDPQKSKPPRTFVKPIDYKAKGVPKLAVGRAGSGNEEFRNPSHIAVCPVTRNLIVCDRGNNRIQVLDKRLKFLTNFGCRGADNGQFEFGGYEDAGGVTVTSSGEIIISDTENDRLQVFDGRGKHLRNIGPALGAKEKLSMPCGIAIDRSGMLYVTDCGNQRVLALKEDGTLVRVFGTKDVVGNWWPTGLAICPDGDVVVACNTGQLELFTGYGQHKNSLCSGDYRSVKLEYACGLAVDAKGNILASDRKKGQVHVMTGNGELICTYGHETMRSEGFGGPIGVAVTEDGDVLIACQFAHAIQML